MPQLKQTSLEDKKMTNCNSHQNCPEGIDPDNFREMVAECAYLKAETRGFAPGYETEDWLEAEQEVSNHCYYRSQPAE